MMALACASISFAIRYHGARAEKSVAAVTIPLVTAPHDVS
jgi:hypothetical protein